MQILSSNTAGVSFEESENQRMIVGMVQDFGAKEIRPYMMKWDEEQIFPVELFRKMGSLGLMGVLEHKRLNYVLLDMRKICTTWI